MRINLDHNGGNVLIAFDDVAEAYDFIGDLEEAIAEAGHEDITSPLINGDGVFTLTVRVDA